jgi:hypothetical protein
MFSLAAMRKIQEAFYDMFCSTCCDMIWGKPATRKQSDPPEIEHVFGKKKHLPEIANLISINKHRDSSLHRRNGPGMAQAGSQENLQSQLSDNDTVPRGDRSEHGVGMLMCEETMEESMVFIPPLSLTPPAAPLPPKKRVLSEYQAGAASTRKLDMQRPPSLIIPLPNIPPGNLQVLQAPRAALTTPTEEYAPPPSARTKLDPLFETQKKFLMKEMHTFSYQLLCKSLSKHKLELLYGDAIDENTRHKEEIQSLIRQIKELMRENDALRADLASVRKERKASRKRINELTFQLECMSKDLEQTCLELAHTRKDYNQYSQSMHELFADNEAVQGAIEGILKRPRLSLGNAVGM